MFKNHAFQVKMVKDAKDTTPQTVLDSLDFATIDKIVKEYAKAAAVGFVVIYAALKTIDTVSQVAINMSNPK
jgi:hypothetical protein